MVEKKNINYIQVIIVDNVELDIQEEDKKNITIVNTDHGRYVNTCPWKICLIGYGQYTHNSVMCILVACFYRRPSLYCCWCRHMSTLVSLARINQPADLWCRCYSIISDKFDHTHVDMRNMIRVRRFSSFCNLRHSIFSAAETVQDDMRVTPVG